MDLEVSIHSNENIAPFDQIGGVVSTLKSNCRVWVREVTDSYQGQAYELIESF